MDSGRYLCMAISAIKRVIWAVIRRSKRVNHTVMWIQNICIHEDSSDGYK